jgi:Cys-rich protein (TIGR01571 family)
MTLNFLYRQRRAKRGGVSVEFFGKNHVSMPNAHFCVETMNGPSAQAASGRQAVRPPPPDWHDGLCTAGGECKLCIAACCLQPCVWSTMLLRASLVTVRSCRWVFVLYSIPWLALVALCIRGFILGYEAGKSGQPRPADPFWVGYLLVGIAASLAILGARARKHLRARYSIAGSSCGDCCVHCWCRWCVIAQEARHVRSVEGPLMQQSHRYMAVNDAAAPQSTVLMDDLDDLKDDGLNERAEEVAV